MLDEQHRYRYFGVYKGAGFLTEHVKKAILKEYFSWVHSILKAQLTADNTMTAICAYAVPVMSLMKRPDAYSQQMDAYTTNQASKDCTYIAAKEAMA
eukprot:12220025-Ditylum_brightwellii.AAC.1